MRGFVVGNMLGLLLLASCGGDPASPSGGGGGPLSATVDGSLWQVAGTQGALQVQLAGNNQIIVAGSDADGRLMNLVFPVPEQPGTVQMGMSAVAFGTYVEGTQTWISAAPGGGGHLTVTSVDGRRVRGTFEFDARATGSQTPVTRAVRQGQFDITY